MENDTSKKLREIWIRDEPNSVTWESLVGTQNYWGDRGICFVKKEAYQSLLEQCEKLAKALEKSLEPNKWFSEDYPNDGHYTNLAYHAYNEGLRALEEYRKFKEEL